MNPSFATSYGITLTTFTIENISLPEEVEKALDTRTKMGVIGDLNAYTQLKAADSIEHAAKNPGLGGAGIGMGVGFGMGNMMGAQMSGAMGGTGGGAPPPLPGQAPMHYNGPSGQAQLTPDEIARRVLADRSGSHMVWQAGWPAWKAWSEVPEIASRVPPEPSAEARFHYHGPGGDGEKSLAEVVAIVKGDPDGAHHLWQTGWSGWKPAADVAAVKAALSAGPPPPPSSGPPPPPTP